MQDIKSEHKALVFNSYILPRLGFPSSNEVPLLGVLVDQAIKNLRVLAIVFCLTGVRSKLAL